MQIPKYMQKAVVRKQP